MAGPIRIAILANGAQARKEFNSTASSADGLGSKVGGVGKKLAVGLGIGAAVAGAAVVKLGADSVKSASAAQQSLGATETVFGKYAKGVIANSNKAATAIGLSANEYRELSNVSGSLLAGAGTPLKKVAGLTDDLNKRAADMAATFGGTTRDAVESISSLLKGEADPIEKYGVSIKQSDVNARLAAKGLDGLTGSALKQAEQQTRLELLFSKTARTQGAFKKESGTLANQQQILAAQFENVKAKVGAALLPVLTTLFTFINTNVIPAVQRVLPGLKAWASEMGDRLAPVVSTVAGFVTGTLVPALTRFGGYVIGTVVPAVAALIQKVGPALQPVLTAVVQVVQKVVAKFKEWQPTIQKVIEVTAKIIAKVVEFSAKILGVVLPPVIKFAASLSIGLVGAVISTISTIGKIIGKVADFGGAVIDGARKVGEFAGKVKDKIDNVVTFFTNLPSKITGALTGAKTLLVETGKNIVQGFINGLDSLKDSIIAKVKELADLIPGWVKRRLGIASPSKVTTYLGKMAGQGLADGLKSVTGKAADQAQKLAEKVIERIKSKIETAKGVRDAITSLRDSIGGALSGDLFGGAGDEEGSALDKFRATLDAAKAKAAEVAQAVQKLINAKVGNGFLQNLLQSGNTELVVQLAGAPDLSSLAASYDAVIAQNEDTGRLVAEQVIGTRLDTVNATVRGLQTDLRAALEASRAERRAPVTVRFTSEQMTRLERGREVQADLDAYRRAGGRGASF